MPRGTGVPPVIQGLEVFGRRSGAAGRRGDAAGPAVPPYLKDYSRISSDAEGTSLMIWEGSGPTPR